jgi:aquaporin Z
MLLKKLLAEFAGTFLIVFIGTGAVVVDQTFGGVVTHLGISTAFGIAVTGSILLLAAISGAHFNPAVTITLTAFKNFPLQPAFLYIIAQLAGAAAASGLLHLIFPENKLLGATLPSGTVTESFIYEFVLTLLLMAMILTVIRHKKSLWISATLIGLVVGFEAYFAGPVCGASMNPARSFSPALVSGHWQHLWLYLVAPVAGALFAALIERFIPSKTTADEKPAGKQGDA